MREKKENERTRFIIRILKLVRDAYHWWQGWGSWLCCSPTFPSTYPICFLLLSSKPQINMLSKRFGFTLNHFHDDRWNIKSCISAQLTSESWMFKYVHSYCLQKLRVWVCLFFLCVIHLHPFTFHFHIYHLKSSRNTHPHLQHLSIHPRRGRSYLLIRRFSFSSSSLLYIGSGCEVSWSKCCSKSKLTQILFGENCLSADAHKCAVCHSLEASAIWIMGIKSWPIKMHLAGPVVY